MRTVVKMRYPAVPLGMVVTVESESDYVEDFANDVAMLRQELRAQSLPAKAVVAVKRFLASLNPIKIRVTWTKTFGKSA